jgi:hypothetical protein
MVSRTALSVILKGSKLSGLIGALICSYGTSWAEPQKLQRWATRVGSKTEMAWQLWHLTEILSAFHPRLSAVSPRNAVTRSCSSIAPEASSNRAGASVPQYGQTKACLAAFQCASAPQLGQ